MWSKPSKSSMGSERTVKRLEGVIWEAEGEGWNWDGLKANAGVDSGSGLGGRLGGWKEDGG